MQQPPEKRPHVEDKGDAEGGAAKQAKVDTNPLTGVPYTPRFYKLLERRQKLPAWVAREDILKMIQKHQVTLLQGETCSGKSTQLPQILLDAGYHVQDGQIRAILCAQPHAAAAMSAAQRVSEELEVQLGTYVGYHIWPEDRCSAETLLKFVGEEALLHELKVDPLLEKYSVIVMDEVHERTLVMDVLLGLLKNVLQKRPALKMVCMSASADMKKLQRHFEAPLLSMPGRVHPVEMFYMDKPEKDYVKVAVRTVSQIHNDQPEGDILVFLPTEDEVDYACELIKKEGARLVLEYAAAGRPLDNPGELVPVPLYQSLPVLQHKKAFEDPPPPKMPKGPRARKVVVATAVAETSFAVDGIFYVVDTGLARKKVYNPRSRLEALMVLPVSQDCAARRAARAGRIAPGKCFRLFAEKALREQLPERICPEILMSELSGVLLAMKTLGVEDVVHFNYVEPPSPEALMRALETLFYLGFLDDDGDITEEGKKACKFNVDPKIAKMLLESSKHHCSNEALSIAAMLSVCVQPGVFMRPKDNHKASDEAKSRFAHLDGDHLTLLNVFHAYKQHAQDGSDPFKFCNENFINIRSLKKAEIIRENLKKTSDELGLPMASTNFQDKEYYPNIRRCLVAGFFMQVAHFEKEKAECFVTFRDAQKASLHPSTSLQHKPEWVVYHEFTMTSKNFLRVTTQVRGEWLSDVAPQYFDLSKLAEGSNQRVALEKIAAKRTQPPVETVSVG